LPFYLVKELEKNIRERGNYLNSKFNFNNAQGKKLNYMQMSPEIINFYINNNSIKNDVSEKINEKVEYADESDKYRIFARLYENEGDFLDWHYDNNFTMGNRYTLVIPVLVDKNNTSEFIIKDQYSQNEIIIPISIGHGVLYNGTITYHRISPQTNGQRRIVIIIPFYSNYKKNIFGNIREFFRNITYSTLTL
jgi:hypothetical protein